MAPVLVIGSIGHAGSQVVAQLSDKGVAVRALVRRPEAARLPARVEMVQGDLASPATLEPALNGVDSLLLLWTAPPATFPQVLERIANRVRRIVFLSAPLKTPHPLFQQPNATRGVAEQMERAIEASGLERTFPRPGMFACNTPQWWGRQLRAGNLVRWPDLDVPTAPIDPRDIAAIGARALCEPGHAGAELSLRIQKMTPDEARKNWSA